jgi:N4-gp56 family major capsid protein
MAQQTYLSPQGRINKLKGEIIAHAVPVEVLGITGMQKKMPKNVGATVTFRRWLPYGATVSSPNSWAAIQPGALAHLTTEGVTPPAETLTPQDFEATLQQYSCLYGVTDKNVDLYEDDVPSEMKKQTGERMGMVREMVRYGVLRGCTNKFFGGTGTTRGTVNGRVTLPLLRKITRSLKLNHAKRITSVLAAGPNFATSSVEAGYLVFASTDCENDIRDLPNFKETSEYAQRRTINEHELGSCENFRFILSPELVGYADSGAAVGSTGLYSTTGSNIDVYPMIIAGEDAWGQVALRGVDSIDPTWIPPSTKDKNDPLGQRGYVGAKCYFTALVLNQGWMAVAEVGIKAL